MKLPSNWSEVTVVQYQELHQIDKEQTDTDQLQEQLAVLLNIMPDDELLEDITVDELFGAVKQLSWMKRSPSQQYKKSIETLHKKNLDKLKLGEFIDLEAYFSEDYIDNLLDICAVLYKQQNTDDWGNQSEEPYVYDLTNRHGVFINLPITDVWGIVTEYLRWKESFLETYEELFEQPEPEIKEEDPAQMDPLLRAEIAKDKVRAKWSWETVLWNLSGGDLTKYEELFELPLLLVFNTLSMRKSLDL